VIPLRDVSRRPVRFPAVTAGLIALNAIVFCIELAFGEPFVARWALVPADVVAGRHLPTIITSMFLHAGWSHILGNMVFFWAFGPEIEDAMGRVKYAVFYLLGGIVAMLAQIAGDPSSTIPSLGASGAIAAVMGAFLVTFPRDQIRSVLVIGWFARVTFIPAALLIGLWFLTQLISLGQVAETQTGGVAYLAHVGGLVFGAVSARFFVNSAGEATTFS